MIGDLIDGMTSRQMMRNSHESNVSFNPRQLLNANEMYLMHPSNIEENVLRMDANVVNKEVPR